MIKYSTEVTYEASDIFDDEIKSAFLIPVVHHADQIDFWSPFDSELELRMKAVVYNKINYVQTVISSVVVGCRHTVDINRKLVSDRAAAALFEMERFPDQSGVNRFLGRHDYKSIEQIRDVHFINLRQHGRLSEVEGRIIVDLDGTPLVANGQTYERTAKGYFPERGDKGYQVSLAYCHTTDEAWDLYLDPGNYHCTYRFMDLMDSVLGHIGRERAKRDLWVRLDGGYGGADNLAFLLDNVHRFVVGSPNDKTAQAIVQQRGSALVWEQHPENPDLAIADAGRHTLTHEETGIQARVRIILLRYTQRDGTVKYLHLATNISKRRMSALEIHDFYQGRQTVEKYIDQGKNALFMRNLRSRRFYASYAFLLYAMMAGNLINWTKHGPLAHTAFAEASLRAIIHHWMAIPARIKRVGSQLIVELPRLDLIVQRFLKSLQSQRLQLPLPGFEQFVPDFVQN